MIKIITLSLVITSIIVTSALASDELSCSISDGMPCKKNAPTQRKSMVDESDLKIPAFPYKPIIGTRNNDAKTVMDMGVALKIYIATYKDSKKILVASHDRYKIVKEASFIVGVNPPEIRKSTGMMTPGGKVPFVFGAGEIDVPSIKTNEKIKVYLDQVAEADRNASVPYQNLNKADDQFDNVIKGYLNKVKGE